MEENKQKYEFEKDKKTYILTMSIILGKFIKIICQPKNQKHIYINQFSKEDLIKINPIFSLFDNIKQIQKEFEKCLLSQKVTIIHNRTFFQIYYYIEIKKTEKIPLNLIYENEPNKNKNYNNILTDIENEIITMEKEQELMKKKINQALSDYELNNINNNKIQENKNINNNINNNSNSKNKIIYFNESKLKNKIKSDIINTFEEYNLLKNKLLSKRKYKISHNIIFKLLYKSSTDSDNAKIFHQKCDDKNNTLIIILTDKGIKFGGFTTQAWEGQNINKKDDNAFVFNLNKLKIYDIIKDNNAITCSEDYGPIFCGYQIFIYNNFLKNGGKTGKANLNYNIEQDYELNNGDILFNIKELEVFEIIFQ